MHTLFKEAMLTVPALFFLNLVNNIFLVVGDLWGTILQLCDWVISNDNLWKQFANGMADVELSFPVLVLIGWARKVLTLQPFRIAKHFSSLISDFRSSPHLTAMPVIVISQCFQMTKSIYEFPLESYLEKKTLSAS